MSDFVTVGSADEIKPGERLVVGIGNAWVVIFNVDGEFYAVEDQCSHDDYELSNGELRDHEIECPKHGATFDIRTGAHLSPPAVTGVKIYAVRVEGDELQVARKPTS